jgi:hypothetical protein
MLHLDVNRRSHVRLPEGNHAVDELILPCDLAEKSMPTTSRSSRHEPGLRRGSGGRAEAGVGRVVLRSGLDAAAAAAAAKLQT